MKIVNGYTLMHEHVKIDLSRIKNNTDTCLNLQQETIKEFKKLYKYGVRNIVEVTNIGMGRDVKYIKEVSKKTGINIIPSTGFYKDPFIPEEYQTYSTKKIAKLIEEEITKGFINDVGKAHVIGEIGTSNNIWTTFEKKLFNAACLAHFATNKPIYTHTTLGTLALEQARFFKRKKVNLKKVVIGHVDLNKDVNYILKVLKTGVNIGFDTIGKNNYVEDSIRVKNLIEIEKKGYIDQVVLSLDLTRKSHLKANGGIGYSYLFTKFIPMLKKAGMSQKTIDKMLIRNPKGILND